MDYAPWCQGMVFVTGHEGYEITLNKAQHNLSVFDAGSIVQGLTEKEYCTTNYQFVISQPQRKKALDVLGNIGESPAKISEVVGFKKIEKLAADGKSRYGELIMRRVNLSRDGCYMKLIPHRSNSLKLLKS